MTQRKHKTERTNWKELIEKQEDFLRPLVREVIQQVLEAEMEEAVGAGKGGTNGRTGGISSRLLWTDVGDPGGKTGATSAARPTRTVSDGSL
jgi:transposase-like protein